MCVFFVNVLTLVGEEPYLVKSFDLWLKESQRNDLNNTQGLKFKKFSVF